MDFENETSKFIQMAKNKNAPSNRKRYKNKSFDVTKSLQKRLPFDDFKQSNRKRKTELKTIERPSSNSLLNAMKKPILKELKKPILKELNSINPAFYYTFSSSSESESCEESGSDEESCGPKKRLMIINLPPLVDQTDLETCFGKYGRVEDAIVYEEEGYGFITFMNCKDAAAAKKRFHGRIFAGKRIKIKNIPLDNGDDGIKNRTKCPLHDPKAQYEELLYEKMRSRAANPYEVDVCRNAVRFSPVVYRREDIMMRHNADMHDRKFYDLSQNFVGTCRVPTDTHNLAWSNFFATHAPKSEKKLSSKKNKCRKSPKCSHKKSKNKRTAKKDCEHPCQQMSCNHQQKQCTDSSNQHSCQNTLPFSCSSASSSNSSSEDDFSKSFQ